MIIDNIFLQFRTVQCVWHCLPNSRLPSQSRTMQYLSCYFKIFEKKTSITKVKIVISDVFLYFSATVTSNGTNNVRPTVSVLQEDLTINQDQYTPLTDDGVSYLFLLCYTTCLYLVLADSLSVNQLFHYNLFPHRKTNWAKCLFPCPSIYTTPKLNNR